MTTTLSSEVRARLDAHLDAVERALSAAGKSREERRQVVDDLESQILDMLAGKTEAPALVDLEEVLAKLDPPAAYGEQAGARADAPAAATAPLAGAAPSAAAAAPAKPRYSRTAIAGFICILISLVVAVPLLVIGALIAVPQPIRVEAVHVENAQGPPTTVAYRAASSPKTFFAPLACILVLLAPFSLAGTVLGCIAYRQIRSSNGMIVGKGLAIFDALFYPVPILLLIAWNIVASL